jgi:hypothetical protein
MNIDFELIKVLAENIDKNFYSIVVELFKIK